MSSDLVSLIQLGHDLTAFKYHELGACTVLFYDYLLTLDDEIKYAWSGNKTWTFWLFVVNRYFPMTYQFWKLAVSYGPRSQLSRMVCEKTAWYPRLAFIFCTLLAQIMITLRIYAITSKNVRIAIGFAIITASQLLYGLSALSTVKEGAQPYPPIPIDAYNVCDAVPHRTQNIAYTSISLFYEFLAFSLIIFVAKRSAMPGLGFPSLLEIIARDATRYFLIIFPAHLAFQITLIFSREALQRLPSSGIFVYLPVMISRIMLSLRKAADPREKNWSIMEPTAADRNLHGMKFFRPRRGTDETGDNIRLEGRHEISLERQDGTSRRVS